MNDVFGDIHLPEHQGSSADLTAMLDLEEPTELGLWPDVFHVDVWIWRAHHHFHRLALELDTDDPTGAPRNSTSGIRHVSSNAAADRLV